MTSTVPSGAPGNALEQSAGVGDDHGLGHAEAADPARLRFGERRLDDRGSHDRDRHVALHVGQRLLAERLGEGVGVRPADAGGPRSPGLDELVLHPALAELFGLRREGGRPGGAELGTGVGTELHETCGFTARRVTVGAQASARRNLAAPVDADVERAVADEDLGCVAATVAGDVARRHGDEVRGDPELVAEVGDARRPEQVDLDRRVERRIERDRGGRVDHDVARGEGGQVDVVQPETIARDIARHRGDPVGHRRVEIGAVLGAQAVEGVVLEDLLAGALGRGRALAVADQQHEVAVGHAAQQPLDERRPDESGAAGDGDLLPGERRGDHG